MHHRIPFARTATVAGLVLAAAAAAPALAAAKPFDTQPTAALCASGFAGVQTLVHSETPVVPPGKVFFAINEQGGAGATATWLNLSTGQMGSAPLVPTQLVEGAEAKAPIALADTGVGTVVSTVFGVYQNAKNETCVLLPGVTTNEVPGEVSTQPVP